MINIVPQNNHILVELEASPEKVTESGFIVAENSRKFPIQGKVIAVGVLPSEISYSIGSNVLFFFGNGIPLDSDQKRLLLKQEDVLAVVEE